VDSGSSAGTITLVGLASYTPTESDFFFV
jgi:hypothetical protein